MSAVVDGSRSWSRFCLGRAGQFRDAVKRMSLCVTVYLPGQPGEQFVFDRGDVSIGRADDNDLVLGERGVSGRHARLLVTGDEITVVDLESTNGTYVNGERIVGPVVLAADHEIALCDYRLQVSLGEGAGSSPSPTPPDLHAGQGAGPSMTAPPAMLAGPEAGERVSVAHDVALEATGTADRSMPPAPVELQSTAAPAMLDDQGRLGPAASFLANADDAAPPATANPPAVMEPPAALDPPRGAPASPAVESPATAEPPAASQSGPHGAVDRADTVEPPAVFGSPRAVSPTAGEPPAVESSRSGPTPRGGIEPPVVEPPVIEPPAAVEPAAAPAGPAVSASAEPPRRSGAERPPTAPEPLGLARSRPTNGRHDAMVPSVHASTPGASAAAPPPMLESSAVPAVPPRDSMVARSSARTGSLRADGPPAGSSPFSMQGVWGEPTPPEPSPAAAPVATPTRALSPDFPESVTSLDGLFVRLLDDPRQASDAASLRQTLAQMGLSDSQETLSVQIQRELAGGDPIAVAVEDPELTELWLHGNGQLVVRRGGAVQTVASPYSCPAALHHCIARLTGRRFTVDEPFVDAFTPGGVHLRAVHGRWTQSATVVMANRADVATATLDDLVGAGEMSREIADLLALCVEQGLRLLVCGGPDVSTAPLLHALAAAAPDHMRQVVVCCGHSMPDASRYALVLNAPQLAALPRLIDTALQFDPARLLVHGVGGSEAAHGLLALNRLAAGGVVSLQAGTASDGLRRLGTMFRLSEGCSQDVAASYIAGAIDLILGVGKLADGRQRLLEVAEPSLGSAGKPAGGATPVAVYDMEQGAWVATGSTPRFFSDLRRRGAHRS
ncbi:MAG: FHA domain-containing protein [Myxococcales bacterium FL481]|nr:MAG: FHA domain-containing protein [Myxococcales bacterium FL481]